MDDMPQVNWLKNSQIKYGWLKALLFIICFLSFGFIFHLLLTIFGGGVIRSVLRVLGLYSGAQWYYEEWVTIALTYPTSTLFWLWIFQKIINKQSFFSFCGRRKGLYKRLYIKEFF